MSSDLFFGSRRVVLESTRDTVTTPHGDKVTVETRLQDGRYKTAITGGPHDGTSIATYTSKAALDEQAAWVTRHTTAIFTCEECNGEGVVEVVEDRAVWGAGGLAGHTTNEWLEPCDQCVDGECFDEDVAPMPDGGWA
tara:strand:+ start:1445 stop:1858 length:414 start_codon:yes stop_codon:yes gene_type:complete